MGRDLLQEPPTEVTIHNEYPPHTQARARTQLPTQAHAHRVQYAHAHTRRFNEATQMYQLDFYGRAQVASCKNLMLIPIVRAKTNNQICFCSFIASLQFHTTHLRHDTRASSGRRRRRGKLLPAAARQNRGQSLQPRLQTTFLLRSGIWVRSYGLRQLAVQMTLHPHFMHVLFAFFCLCFGATCRCD